MKYIIGPALAAAVLSSPALAATDGLDPALRAFLVAHYPTNPTYAAMEKEWPTRVATARVKRADGGYDIVAYISGRAWCGSGGCELMILEPEGASYRVLGQAGITKLPIRRLATSSHGHPDLGVIVSGGGILKGYEARLRFDGKTYPDNPSVPPAAPIEGKAKGEVLIAPPADGAPDTARGELLYSSDGVR